MTDIWHVIGLKGTGSDRFAVEDLFVPERHSATREEEARREDGLLYRFSSLQLYAAGRPYHEEERERELMPAC